MPGPVIPALLQPPRTNETATVGNNLGALGALGALGGADLEAVVEAAVDLLEVAHSAGTGGLSALGLLAPVDCRTKLVSQYILNTQVFLSKDKRLLDILSIEQRGVGGERIRTLASLSGRVTAVGTSRLLDVEGAFA